MTTAEPTAPDSRSTTIARILASAPKADIETLLAVTWMLERDEAGELDAHRYISPSRGGGYRGYAVYDLTGAAVVAAVNAVVAVLSLLGRRAATRGMPVLDTRPR